MPIPVTQQPSLDAISRDLEAWERWVRARARNERPLPPLPALTDPAAASGMGACYGLASRLVLLCAQRAGIACDHPELQLWSARHRILTDKYWYEPARCSLNHAFTDLGLALLEMGDVPGAVECLRRSWRVYPCPHNTTFGLSTRLWKALEGVPEAAAARSEYERIARRFSPGFGAPPQRLTRPQTIRRIVKALWTDHRSAEP